MTIHDRIPALLTLPSYHVASMFFIPFGKWGVAAYVSEDRERYGKN